MERSFGGKHHAGARPRRQGSPGRAEDLPDQTGLGCQCVAQAKRYAERWCAARLYPEMRLRAAVARLLDASAGRPLDPLPGLPPTLEQQQARRLAEAGVIEAARVKEALAPPRPTTVAKPRAKDTRSKRWVREGITRHR